MRAIVEGSNSGEKDQSSLTRTFKRALGLEARVAVGVWLTLKVGKQRRSDGQGDENGSAINLSYSPKATLSL